MTNSHRVPALECVLRETWKIYWSRFTAIAIVVAAVWLPLNALLELIPVDGARGFRLYWRAAQMAQHFIGVIATLAIIFIVADAREDRRLTAREALSNALGAWPTGVGATFLAGLRLLGLFLLLIVPGLIWLVYYAFVLQAIALRDASASDALAESKKLVVGQWWPVCWRLVVIGTVCLLPTLLLSLGWLFLPETYPVNVLFSTVVDVFSALLDVALTVFFLHLAVAEPIAYESAPAIVPD